MGGVIQWSVSEPGRPYRKLLDLASGRPASLCNVHHGYRTDEHGICFRCLSDWRSDVWGADPESWAVCEVCGYPLHPLVEAEGFMACPSCEVPGVGSAGV